MNKPDILITVPNGDLPIEGTNKYIVLKDFWLKDVCLKKGQIITDPVSKRWIQLRLIKPYIEELNEKNNSENENNSENSNSIENITISEIFEKNETKPKRKYTKHTEKVLEVPEKSEILVERMESE